ncbi:MAG: 2-dehydropantoate 2-reductase, partial [Chloroflexota bacterium]
RLAHAGRDVTFVARSQREAMEKNGLRVQSFEEDVVVNPVKVASTPAEAGPVDVVLFCVKAYDTEAAAEAMKPLIGDETVVIPVLNGIDHVPIMQRVLGKDAVLGGLTNMTAHVVAPGHVERVGDHGAFQFGEVEGGMSPRCEAIHKVLDVPGVPITAIPNITERMWWKLGLISSVSVFPVVHGTKAVVWSRPETRDLIYQAAKEAHAVAEANGISLGDGYPDEVMGLAEDLPMTFKPSMGVALEKGQPLEIEGINGTMVRYGQEAGVPTPVNAFMYACLLPYKDGPVD